MGVGKSLMGQKPMLLDHFVGRGEQSLQNVQPERLRGLQIAVECHFGCLLDRQVRTFAFADPDIADTRNSLLLSSRRRRTNHGCTGQSDEFAPSHGLFPVPRNIA
jgi:hypothetical protein